MRVEALEIPDIQSARLPSETEVALKVGLTKTWSGLDISELLEQCSLGCGISRGVSTELSL